VNKSVLAIDIGTTSITTIVAQNDYNNKINILGRGISVSSGINKGTIIDIDKASDAIEESVNLARTNLNIDIEDIIVSISGVHTKSLRSNGFINIPSGHITHKEINQVLNVALYDAKIVPDYEAIHVIPLYFKVDNADTIDNPLNMNGSRLEVYAHIITAKRTYLTNIQNALKKSNLEVTHFMLSSYASAIATLEDDQKVLGTAVIDLGGSTTELAIFKNNSIIYDDVVAFGSENITNDLSVMSNIPLNVADQIKKKYATLYPKEHENYINNITNVKTPILGNESEQQEISLDLIQPIVHARVEEILCFIYDKINNNNMTENMYNIILTGGMSQIPGIELLAKKIFNDIPVKISTPKNIPNGYIDFNTPTLSTIVGLLLYALDTNPQFELNSQKQLRTKEVTINNEENKSLKENKILKNEIPQEENNELSNIKIEEKSSILDKFWKKLSEWL